MRPDVNVPRSASSANFPGSVLFACDYNAVRSPIAEGIMKKRYGTAAYVQSAGVRQGWEIDGFAIAACEEIGVELSRHRSRTMDEMEEWGDDISAFELVVALSPAAQRKALEFTAYCSLEVEYWPVLDPTGMGENREQKLEFYRQTRDQIAKKIAERFGDPKFAAT